MSMQTRKGVSLGHKGNNGTGGSRVDRHPFVIIPVVSGMARNLVVPHALPTFFAFYTQ